MGAVQSIPILAPVFMGESVVQAQAQIPGSDCIVQAYMAGSIEQAPAQIPAGESSLVQAQVAGSMPQMPMWAQASGTAPAPQVSAGIQAISMPNLPMTSIMPVEKVGKDTRKRTPPAKEIPVSKKPKVVKASVPTSASKGASQAKPDTLQKPDTLHKPDALHKPDTLHKPPGKRAEQQELAGILRTFLTSNGFYTSTSAFETSLKPGEGGYHKAKAKHFSAPLKIATLIRTHLIPQVLGLDPAQPHAPGIKELIMWHSPSAGWNGMWNLCPFLTLEHGKYNIPLVPAVHSSVIETHRR